MALANKDPKSWVPKRTACCANLKQAIKLTYFHALSRLPSTDFQKA